jgi:hypothetical protein
MGLVRMQDVALAGQALPPLAAIPERLHPRQGEADRIGVVAVRGEGLAEEMRLQALDPLRAGADPDPVARAAGILRRVPARSFKTAPDTLG